MGDYRQIDQPELLYVAALIAEASGVLHSLAVVSGDSSRLWPVVAALERTAEDIRRRRIEFGYSRHSPVQTDPRPFSMAGFSGASERWGSTSDGKADDRIRFDFVRGRWHGSAAVSSRQVSGSLGTFSAAALIADGQADGWIGFDDWGLEIGGVVGAGAHLAQIEYGWEAEQIAIAGEVFAGVEGAAEGQLDLRPTDGDVGIDLGLDAFVGMGAAGSVAVGMSGAEVVTGGEVGVGLGLDVDGAATYAAGRFNFDFGASAFLGLGGGFDVSLEVDLAAIGSEVLDAMESATDWIASLWP